MNARTAACSRPCFISPCRPLAGNCIERTFLEVLNVKHWLREMYGRQLLAIGAVFVLNLTGMRLKVSSPLHVTETNCSSLSADTRCSSEVPFGAASAARPGGKPVPASGTGSPAGSSASSSGPSGNSGAIPVSLVSATPSCRRMSRSWRVSVSGAQGQQRSSCTLLTVLEPSLVTLHRLILLGELKVRRCPSRRLRVAVADAPTVRTALRHVAPIH